MANNCMYEMKVVGSKEAINRVVTCLKAHYNYSVAKPEHKHFFRVFEAYDDKIEKIGDNTYSVFVWGDCAWSVSSCMLSGAHTYYNDLKKDFPEIFMGTDLKEQSKDCTIEVFSEETGMGFSEHYIFKNGECLCDDCVEIENAGYDEDGNITTDIDWDTYDGDWLTINPNKISPEDTYNWTI